MFKDTILRRIVVIILLSVLLSAVLTTAAFYYSGGRVFSGIKAKELNIWRISRRNIFRA